MKHKLTPLVVLMLMGCSEPVENVENVVPITELD